MLGREQIFGGEWVVRSAGLTHFRRSSSRVRVLLYIRPPRHRREIAAMGRKGAPANAHRPRRLPHPPRLRLYFRARVHTSASAFTLPPHTLRRRPRRLWPPAAAVIHNGLSTSLLTALCKTFSASRLRTRIYNISFARRLLLGVSASLWGRGRAVVVPWPAPPSAGWGRAKAKADAPSRSAPHFPRLRPRPCQLMGVAPCAKAEVHKANPAPVRALSPRQLVYRRAPARLCGESLCAKAEVRKAIPAPARAFSPRQLVYRPAPAV